jgi:lysozyme
MTRSRMKASRAWWRAAERRYYAKMHKATTPGRRTHWRGLAEKARRRVREYDSALREISHVSDRGINFIKDREGVVDHLYHDSRGFCTGGVGHLVRQDHCTLADHRKYDGFTEKDWLALLAKDLDRFEKAVADTFKGAKLPVTQNRFDACVSLAFNIGEAGFRSSTVAKRIKAGWLAPAGDAFLLWDQPPELLGRRKLERALFLS